MMICFHGKEYLCDWVLAAKQKTCSEANGKCWQPGDLTGLERLPSNGLYIMWILKGHGRARSYLDLLYSFIESITVLSKYLIFEHLNY